MRPSELQGLAQPIEWNVSPLDKAMKVFELDFIIKESMCMWVLPGAQGTRGGATCSSPRLFHKWQAPNSQQAFAAFLAVQNQWLLLRHHSPHVDERGCRAGGSGKSHSLGRAAAEAVLQGVFNWGQSPILYSLSPHAQAAANRVRTEQVHPSLPWRILLVWGDSGIVC